MLKTKHFFPFVRMIRALDAQDVLKEIVRLRKDAQEKSKEGSEVDVLTEEVGLNMVAILIERLPNAEKETFEFLGVYTGKSRQELEEQDITETFEIFKSVVAEANFVSFFKSAAE